MTQPVENTLLSERPHRRGFELFVLAGVLLATLARVWCTPGEAMDHLLVPDGAEYIATAYRWTHGQGFNMSVAGTVYPMRFAPGFAVLMSPIYLIFRNTPEAGIYPVTLMALLAAFAAFRLARELTGSLFAAVFAALALGFQSTAVQLNRSILADGPAVAVTLLALLFGLRAHRSRKLGYFVATGCMLGIATTIRPMQILLAPIACVIFVVASPDRSFRQMTKLVLALMLPTVAAFLAMGMYQVWAFGSFSRTGYAFWVPLPCEFPELTFAWRYFPLNWYHLGGQVLWACAAASVGVVLLAWAQGRSAAMAALCFLVGPVIFSVIHLFFLWPTDRYQMLFFVVAMLVLGAGLGAAFTRLGLHAIWSLPAVVAAGVAFLSMPRLRMPFTPYPSIIKEVVANTPANSLIVTDATASLFDVFAGGRQQYIATRNGEYASKLIAPKPLVFPQGRPPELTWPTKNHRNPLLRPAGAVDAVPTVASEDLGPVDVAIAAGRPVFLDIVDIPTELHSVFTARYDCVQISPCLVRVDAKTPTSRP